MTTGSTRTAGYRMARAAGRYLTRPVGTIRAVATDAPHVVLTYDDGPDPKGTPLVLEALATFGATATFFVLVGRARRHPDLLAELIAAGHEVALHGLDHIRLTGVPAPEVLRRTQAGRAELEDLTGTSVRWFRAPYGALLLPHWRAVRRAGLMPVVWGATPGDWRHVPEETMARDALAGSRPGAIVLAHDGHAGPDDGVDDGPPPPIDRGLLATMMLTGLGDQGLVGRSLSDALCRGTAARWAWFVR
ncbi:polysaccharide deacetylase family protein [Micromonospora chersina]|uniref:polysaccharide deacetylase family protein n=1 Tax=Micromonospora chersina TaxID=47854 RepID=UPI003799D1E4